MEQIQEQEFDIRSYLRVIRKRKWTILLVFTLVVLSVAVHTFTDTPIYRATARIVIEKENPNVVSIQEVMAVDSTGTDYYQTQYQIIKSRTVAREVVQRLNLKESEEFFPKKRTNFISDIKQQINDMLSIWKETIIQFLNKGVPEQKPQQSLSDDQEDPLTAVLVTKLIDRITVEPVRNSRLVDVHADATNPVFAAKMANEVVRAYIDQNLEMKLKATKDAVKWLSDRIEEEREKVEAAENALLKYKEQAGIITDFSSDSENITAEKLAKLNAQVIEAESQRVEAETRYRQALEMQKNSALLDSIPEVLANPLIQEIKKMEVGLYNRMSELSKKYGQNHPQMVALQSELDELQKRKAKETEGVINSLRNNYQLALAREKSLKSAFEKQKNESLELNKKAVQYGVLKRQTESSRQLYELLIKRFKETSLTEEMKTGNIRIIDEAEIPKAPIKPNKKRNLLLAVAVGISLGIGLAFLLEYLDNTVKLPDEVKDYIGIPYLGPIPSFDTREKTKKFHADLISFHSPKSSMSESFRGVRTGILYSSPDREPKVILVTSAEPAEGKTLCVANLAITMAQSGSKVLLLDCDMRRPRIHSVFEKQRDKGVSSILIGQASSEETIVPTEIENLDIIPCGPIPPNPSELLGSKKMKEFLEYCRSKYDRILLDSPPITAVTDSVILSQLVDGVVIIIRTGHTPKQVVKSAIGRLKIVNAPILGAVLNSVSPRKDSYYYYQYYYYYSEDGTKEKRGHRKKKSTDSPN